VPQFIVADPGADEDLWVEVLHFGCYDLLRTPFDPEQALRVVSRAWDFWKREQTRLAALSKLAQPSEQSFPQCRRTAVCP
jgi:DNA-binding NtrC family response regulator